MARFRLAPSAWVGFTPHGAVLHSPFGDLTLPGEAASALVRRMLPYAERMEEWPDGPALPDMDREICSALRDILLRHGIIEPADETACPLSYQHRFFTYCGEHNGKAKLKAARVLLVGSEPWIDTALLQLAASGVGALHLSRDAGCLIAGASDLVNCTRAVAPECTLSISDTFEPGPWSLIINGLPDLGIARQQALARFVAKDRYTALAVSPQGVQVRYGPITVAGEPPCWECARHRLLAHAEEPWSAHLVHQHAARNGGLAAQRTLPVPAAGFIGHAVALMSIELLLSGNVRDWHGTLIVQNLLNLCTTLHTVVPLPWCDICGGAYRGSSMKPVDWKELAMSDRDNLLATFAPGWVDPRTGITSSITARLRPSARGSMPYTASGRLSAFSDADAAARYMGPYFGTIETFGGKGATCGEALVSALAECLERYSASHMQIDNLPFATVDQLDGNLLDPRRLALYSDEQYDHPGFPFVRFDPSLPYHWVAGRWADNGRLVNVPARLAYYAEIDVRYVQVTSNGLAAGGTFEDAALRAICELVERDAFLITWLCRLPARRIDIDGGGDPKVHEVVRALESFGAELHLHLLDVGLPIPVVLSTALGDGVNWPGLTVALGAHPSLQRAVRNAVFEQGYSGPFLSETVRAGERRIPREPSEVKTFLDHALFYAPPERRDAIAFLDAGATPPLKLADIQGNTASSLENCVEALANRGVRIVLVDVTSPDVALSGLRVVRALAEGLQPLHCGFGLERVTNARLCAFIREGLNPDVHPMC